VNGIRLFRFAQNAVCPVGVFCLLHSNFKNVANVEMLSITSVNFQFWGVEGGV